MSWLKKFGRMSLVAAAGGALIGYSFGRDRHRHVAYASWTTGYTPAIKWDWNWDRRDVHSLVKPTKSKEDINNNISETNDERLEKVRPTATRHLIFIRHGQYNLEGVTDADRYLTKLGREQAALTGKRLNELSFPYSKVVYSTMTRATETAKIILDKLENMDEVEHCDLLREGAPIPPEPPIGSWKPEMHFYADGARIEAAFRKYVHRAPPSQEKDSYEIIVCHANVIRYFVCRALQVPPEAWLRLSLHNGQRRTQSGLRTPLLGLYRSHGATTTAAMPYMIISTEIRMDTGPTYVGDHKSDPELMAYLEADLIQDPIQSNSCYRTRLLPRQVLNLLEAKGWKVLCSTGIVWETEVTDEAAINWS
ncbi:hypothetical protein Pcinc_007246 [Petrolisthes cinctipes]|uniref:GTP cyclohydrolase 1 feedback regulatory protein n=1 Tax=Petrolisthes cinctipes TaxID=88211 RepID=A0AAE1KYR2_PETCI|nr:hypothetical protein Pcinc_007246 [Petrolisthes cinctipes]